MDININSTHLKILKELNIAIVYLFGSCAEGKALSVSDIDIGIVLTKDAAANLEEDTGKIYNQVYDIVTEIFPSRHIDIVFLHKAPLELRFDVINHGRILFESSHEESLDFEEKTMVLYADFKPLLKEINDTIINRA